MAGEACRWQSFLQARGFAHVANIAGGINAWSVELDPAVPRY
jgi:rhodanese-related sulfurtransferase